MKAIKHGTLSQVFVVLVMAVLFALSLLLFVQKRPGPRRVFYFAGFEGTETQKEVRFLARNPVQGDVRLFVDELLLGPLTNGYQMLFVPGTKAVMCEEDKRTLYVDLTMDLEAFFAPERTALPWEEGAALFRKNIRANFPALRDVVLFINGKELEGEGI
jgi:hypothetical protein